jgi:Ulp1 family protease
MNTDPSTRPGEHWVVLFVNKENKLEYFDSFAHPPLYEEIGNLMEINNVKEFKYNTRPLQNVMSSTCGVYCILFVKLRCEGLSFDGFIDFFSNNTIKNDIKAFVSLYLN